MSHKETVIDKARMLVWLLVGLALYFASFQIGSEHPAWQTVTYKLGHVTTLAWVGYWISRQALGRIYMHATVSERTARAILIGAVIIAGSLGL